MAKVRNFVDYDEPNVKVNFENHGIECSVYIVAQEGDSSEEMWIKAVEQFRFAGIDIRWTDFFEVEFESINDFQVIANENPMNTSFVSV